jgi:threonine aldolase
MIPIDLRSDTVTHPAPGMREAMAQAPVGDDVYGEDPTVNTLQAMAATMLGKEAGLFVPSGTMGNLASILAHCNRGDEIIMGNISHTFLNEAGGIAALGGIHPRTIQNQPDGTLAPQDIISAIRSDNPHYPTSRLITLENTQNACGGIPLSLEYTKSIGDLAKEYNLILHIDGARIFNAAAALDVTPAELTAPADSITFCLSKGLCAPAGSLICGDEQFIYKAHRIRKQLGGGMRQAGVLASAGIVALETIVPRLVEDHIRANELASGIKNTPGLNLDLGSPYTNMVFLKLDDEVPLDAREVAIRLKEKGVLVGVIGPRRFRLVTHYWIDSNAITQAVDAFREVLETNPR